LIDVQFRSYGRGLPDRARKFGESQGWEGELAPLFRNAQKKFIVYDEIKGRVAMITVANRIYVKPEYADAFEQRFRERAGLVDQMPGFVSNQVLRPVNEGDPYVVFTIWNSREDFLNWVRSDAFTKGHAKSGTLPREAFSETNKLEMHEVVQDSSRPEVEPEPHGGPFRMH
jgi:heme-degrading monooxygenase HmoA